MRITISKPCVALVLFSTFLGTYDSINTPVAAATVQEAEAASRWEKMQALTKRAKEAIQSGDTKSATKYAQQMLQENTDSKTWYYGNVIDESHQILGLAALKEGRLEEAKKQLLEAGKTPGSPQLDSFGPAMVLAQKLLAKGEKQTVIQYLDLVARFWAYMSPAELKRYEKEDPKFAKDVKGMIRENQLQISDWKAQIRAGKNPKLHYSAKFYG